MIRVNGFRIAEDLLASARFYLEFYDLASSEFDSCSRCLFYLSDVMKQYGDTDAATRLEDSLDLLVKAVSGTLAGEVVPETE